MASPFGSDLSKLIIFLLFYLNQYQIEVITAQTSKQASVGVTTITTSKPASVNVGSAEATKPDNGDATKLPTDPHGQCMFHWQLSVFEFHQV